MSETASVIIPDGYTFKSLIEIIHSCHESGNLIFTPIGIKYEQISLEGDILIEFLLRRQDLLEYKIMRESHKCGLYMPTFRALTKTLTKKDSLALRIIVEDGKSNIEMKPSTKSSISYYRLVTIPQDDFIEYSRPESANVTIPVQEFSKTCLDLSKSSHTFFHIYAQGIKMEGINVDDGHSVNRIVNYGDTTTEVKRLFRVDRLNMKAFSKIHHLAPSGVIKLYQAGTDPVQIQCPIGYMGTISFYLFSLEEIESQRAMS